MNTKENKNNNCFGKLTMKCIPKNVFQFLIDKQTEFRKESGTLKLVSMETAVIRLLKTHPDFIQYVKE